MEAVNWSLVSSTVHYMRFQEVESQSEYDLGLRVGCIDPPTLAVASDFSLHTYHRGVNAWLSNA